MTQTRLTLYLLTATLLLTSCAKAPEETAKAADPVSAPKAEPKAAAAPVVETITVPAGTPLSVRMLTSVSSDSHATGETVTGELANPLLVQGKTIASRGAQVTGIVADSSKGGKIKGLARISVRMTQLKLDNGKVINLSTSAPVFQAEKTVKRDVVAIGVASGIGSAIGAIAGKGKGAAIGAGAGAGAGTAGVLATRGKAAVVPAESVVSFSLRNPVSITR